MIAMLAGVFGFYVSVLKARDVGGQVTRDSLLAKALLRRMAEELRQACDIVPGDGRGFSGTHNQIEFVRAKMPEGYAFDKHDSIADQLPPGQEDLCRITYELVWDEEQEDDEGVKICHGLLRSEQKTFDPNPKLVVKGQEDKATAVEGEEEEDKPGGGAIMPVERELVAPEIKYIRFEYFDGAEWQDRWKNETANVAQGSSGGGLFGGGGGQNDHALPQAVRITIGKKRVPPEDEELNITQLRQMDERARKQLHHPDRFTVVIYLEQADQSLLSSRRFGSKNNPDLQTGGQ